MNNHSLFSVLIAQYNNGRFLQTAIDSIKAQTYTNWEIILVDDASTDDSTELYKSYENDGRIKIYYNEENRGCGYTKKRCAELANGEIFGFLDPDDALTEDALELSVKCHEENPEAGLVYTNRIVCNESMIPYTVSKCKQVTDYSVDYFKSNTCYPISHFATFKKSVYNMTEGIDGFLKRAFDSDIYLKMCEAAPVKYLDKDLYYYRVHRGGISTYENVEKSLYWRWVGLIKMAERRGVNLEDLFVRTYVSRVKYDKLQAKINRIKEIWFVKLARKSGILKLLKLK